MIESGAQIDCVHKFIYGHNNSTSHNQGETRSISPTQRGIRARRRGAHAGRRRLGVADRPRIEDQHESVVQLAQAFLNRGACRRQRAKLAGGRQPLPIHRLENVGTKSGQKQRNLPANFQG